ncbi:MAG: carbamoyltransferase C-terminal domain-containing protein [Acidobacteriia bacterium]|nr:carbamoyltransferase C-terminal domain-containing protein [Terriglobia bacterium]
MYILGLTTMGESAAALLRDGQLVAAAEEERFSRKKHHIGFPFNAVRYCLDEAGIGLKDVAYVGHYWKPWVLGHRIIQTLATLPTAYSHFRARVARGRDQLTGAYRVMFKLRSTLERNFGPGPYQLVYVDHHMSHAASAFLVSPFDSAAVFTVDGVGEDTTTLFAHGQGTRIREISRVRLPHSLGQFYSAVTNFLGFDMFQGDEYKVMGMAAWGEPEFADALHQKVLKSNGHGDFRLDISYVDHQLARKNLFSEKMKQLLGEPRLPKEEILQRHFNVAASAQRVLEDIAMDLVEYLRRQTHEENLVMAGGVALNSVMNGRIVRDSGFKNIYIQPAAMDAGGSLGSALYVWHTVLGHGREFVMRHAYTGPGFTQEQCLQAIQDRPLGYVEASEEDVIQRTARSVADGKLVAWFQGRMEWGPRALGSRSFLADPRRPEIKETINRKIKLREPFRPFAPSILEEYCEEVFGARFDAPFMITVFPVREEMKKKIPAVIHVDGTARPQLVSKKESPRYWKVIDEFRKISGVPVVLNTSFNIQEPIVCTPQDAVNCFLRSDADLLVMDRLLITKK